MLPQAYARTLLEVIAGIAARIYSMYTYLQIDAVIVALSRINGCVYDSVCKLIHILSCQCRKLTQAYF